MTAKNLKVAEKSELSTHIAVLKRDNDSAKLSPSEVKQVLFHLEHDGAVFFNTKHIENKAFEHMIADVGPIVSNHNFSVKVMFTQRMIEWLQWDWLSKYRANLDPKRKLYGREVHELAPATSGTQGPHQEAAPIPYRNAFRYVGFCCVIPAESFGETAVFDMAKVFAALPKELQDEFRSSRWVYPLAENLANFSTTGTFPVDCVMRDKQGRECLQIYGFGKDIAPVADAVKTILGRTNDVFEKFYGGGLDENADIQICKKDDPSQKRPLTAAELKTVYETCYRVCHLQQWSSGDVVLIDNIRMAHARMYGKGESRKLLFIHFKDATDPKNANLKNISDADLERLRKYRANAIANIENTFVNRVRKVLAKWK